MDFVNFESPKLTPNKSINPLMERIDWLMTYRTDSDIYSPYGRIDKCNNNNWKPNYKFENKRKNIAWIVSHCKTDIKREEYVKKLQQYIDVDVYGNCGQLKCDRNSKTCHQMIQQNYKFYLSFENAVSTKPLQ